MSDKSQWPSERGRASSECSVLRDLRTDICHLPLSSITIAVAAVAAVVLLASGGDSSPTTIAACIGTVATLLSLLVALAIFSWTRRDSAGHAKRAVASESAIREALRRLSSDVLNSTDEADPEDIPPVPPDDSFEEPLTVAGRQYDIVTEPLQNDGAWWRWMLSRIGKVADDIGPDQTAAQELLKLPLSSILATAKLAGNQRGNRRTVLITQSGSDDLRYWSVFVGKGSHVKDITEQITTAP